MGPLSELWYVLEEFVANPEKLVSKEDREELIQYVEQTVMLTEQTFNTITYSRRMNVLTSIGQENKKAKDNLKDHADILQTSKSELFVEGFRKIFKEKAKARKDSNSVYKPQQRPSEASSSSFHQDKRPKGPSGYSKSTEGRNPQPRYENNKQDGGNRRFPNQGGKKFKKFGKLF